MVEVELAPLYQRNKNDPANIIDVRVLDFNVLGYLHSQLNQYLLPFEEPLLGRVLEEKLLMHIQGGLL